MKKYIYFAMAMLMAGSFVSCTEEGPEDEGNVIIVGQNIETPTTWLGSKTYVVERAIYVDANLTIEPGTVIKFKSGSSLSFGSYENMTLTANGTEDKPIVFTSFSANPAPGAWEGLWFYDNALSNSSMAYCQVMYAGQNDYPALNFDVKIKFNNCTVSKNKKNGIYSVEGFVEFNGNTIEDQGAFPIDIASKALHTLGVNNAITCEPGYGIRVRGGTLEGATPITWKKQTVPYYIVDAIYVDQSLTIDPGTTLQFQADGSLSIGSHQVLTFNALGTETEKIIFTSAAATPAPGAWAGLFFYEKVTGNSKMKYCVVEYAGKDNNHANITLSYVNGLTIENCTIRKSSGYGVYSWGSTWNNIDNIFEDNALGDISTHD
ncbi:MAG: hypothetical protein WBI34_04190 [Tenuifilaceae bacterium]|jgi:hypothetical protein|nr:hypothetical protein [Bacteroidales bacterium]MDI9515414.1 hypothetical protein [Bacteroidota bacterium]NLH55992.1 hypothetical protein [Rikenellaceae bacterium]OQC63073.1 MAG: hypothetical protein BWX49_01396 [Bacteroidetes bacterium ADurb.Bin008]HNV82370.1 hypothetical protein [Tenuifilaceae bacterium]